MNKIQEENNKSADEEEGEVDDDPGELSDDPSTLPDEAEPRPELPVPTSAPKPETEDNPEVISKDPMPEAMDIYDPKRFAQNLPSFSPEETSEETSSIKSCDVTSLRRIKQHRRLHRAHSCGSLMSLKERSAILGRNLPVLWDFLAATGNVVESASSGDSAKTTSENLTLQLAASNPITMLQLQGTSRCCNLC